MRPGRTAEPIFTLNSSSDVFPRKEVPLGISTVGDVIWGKYAPKVFKKWA